tara:strand:+ start:314 stop:1096 length:783 start_codon:yes stop_codon:yes gene_type:complete
MSVLNHANKQMLLELCGSNGINTIDTQFQTFFDTLCVNYNSNRLEYNNIQEINKKILEECFYYSQQMADAINQKKKEAEREPQQVQQIYSPGTTELKTLDSKDLRIQKDSDFTMKLKSREEAFKTLISKPIPNQVTFEEKEQDVPSQNLDVLMKQSLADREKELQLILNNKGDKKAEEWLKPIETSDKPPQKKVSFNLEEPKNERQEVVNLLSKLKPKRVQSSDQNNEIINLLKKVLENQEKILSKLNKEDTEITAILED